MTERNPHAGFAFTDGDEQIAANLEAVSVPALLCSLVHMSGDPSWIRGPLAPRAAMYNDYSGAMTPDERAEVRRLALPVIAAYRDGGCVAHLPDEALATEMMSFLIGSAIDPDVVPMFRDDLQLDGADPDAIRWGNDVPPEVAADSHTIVIGCGEAGILTGIRLQQAGLPFTIIEKNAGPGGTWWENRYPGARVDVGSLFYCYSFEPADHWTEYFVRQPELRDYFARVVADRGLTPHCRFSTTVLGASWNEATQRWTVELRTADGTIEHLDARFVVSAVGALNTPKLPDIDGMDSFAGPSFHSARWPDDLSLAGKRVAQVGAGASGFQIAPTIADEVAHLTIFQRTAQWMMPNFIYHDPVPAGDAWAMRHLPFYGRWLRFLMFYPGAGLDVSWTRVDPDHDDPTGETINAGNAERRDMLVGWITSQLADRPDLVDKSIPHYPTSAKRMLQDNGSWLTCLRKPNVELIRTGIERIEPNGVVTADGTLHEADVIVYATGFRHNDFLWPLAITGRGGVALREQWGHEPTAYLGITVPNFPNLFCLYGPGTNLAQGASLIFQSENQVHYVMEAIRHTLTAGHRTIEVRRDVHDRYVEHYTAEIAKSVWAHPSVRYSHFKNPDGKVFTLSPWTIPQYWRWTRSLDPAHYVVA